MTLKDASVRWYPREEQRDSVIHLRRMIDDFVEDGSCVLDVGAGAGELFPYSLKGRVKDMVGVDVDPRVKANPMKSKRHNSWNNTPITRSILYSSLVVDRNNGNLQHWNSQGDKTQ